MASVLSGDSFCLVVHLLSELSNSLAVQLLKHLSFDFPTLPLDFFGAGCFPSIDVSQILSLPTTETARQKKIGNKYFLFLLSINNTYY